MVAGFVLLLSLILSLPPLKFDGLGNIVALCSWIKRHSLEVKKRGVWRVVWKKPKAAVGVLLLLIFMSLIISDIDNGVAVAVPLEAELHAEPDELWGFSS
jgi:hypothetical protein